jgi:Domain of unknown function (DUF5615)
MPKRFHKHKLLLDENMPPRAGFPRLNQHFDVKHVRDDLNHGALDDPEVYQLAVIQGRIVVTFNGDDFRAVLPGPSRMIWVSLPHQLVGETCNLTPANRTAHASRSEVLRWSLPHPCNRASCLTTFVELQPCGRGGTYTVTLAQPLRRQQEECQARPSGDPSQANHPVRTGCPPAISTRARTIMPTPLSIIESYMNALQPPMGS